MRRIGVALLALIPACAQSDTITDARYSGPTARYAHGVLGDAIEWEQLEIDSRNRTGTETTTRIFRLPYDHVFEDTAPRVVDVTGDGSPEVIVVETDVRAGAALAIYDGGGKLAETPHIGQSNRWLAPVGAADLDGDGRPEIAFVDRPHLARNLHVLRLENGRLRSLASLSGVTNHRIGDAGIIGGIRTCNGTPEIVLASADWSRLIAVSFDGSRLSPRDIGAHDGPSSVSKALDCT